MMKESFFYRAKAYITFTRLIADCYPECRPKKGLTHISHMAYDTSTIYLLYKVKEYLQKLEK